ncbi:uncharacterized protein AMSG_03444, partial [Thecamonas trahens ATCC 50062]
MWVTFHVVSWGSRAHAQLLARHGPPRLRVNSDHSMADPARSLHGLPEFVFVPKAAWVPSDALFGLIEDFLLSRKLSVMLTRLGRKRRELRARFPTKEALLARDIRGTPYQSEDWYNVYKATGARIAARAGAVLDSQLRALQFFGRYFASGDLAANLLANITVLPRMAFSQARDLAAALAAAVSRNR